MSLGDRLVGGKPAVALDRTAFYPTGGGQPNDLGTLDGVPVLDVIVDDGVIWHSSKPSFLGTKCAASWIGRAASTTCSSTRASISCRRRSS